MQNSTESTALIRAVCLKDDEANKCIVYALLDNESIDVNLQDLLGNTALLREILSAGEAKNYDILNNLLQREDINCDIIQHSKY